MTELWHDECRRLRAEGLSQPQIAKQLKQRPLDIRLVLNESAEQKRTLRRARERQQRKPRSTSERKPRPKFIEYWKARAAAPDAITPEDKRAAILAFAQHKIDRAELMRRITPRSKWSAAGFLRVE